MLAKHHELRWPVRGLLTWGLKTLANRRVKRHEKQSVARNRSGINHTNTCWSFLFCAPNIRFLCLWEEGRARRRERGLELGPRLLSGSESSWLRCVREFCGAPRKGLHNFVEDVSRLQRHVTRRSRFGGCSPLQLGQQSIIFHVCQDFALLPRCKRSN